MNVKFKEYFQINNAFFEKKLTQIIIPAQTKSPKPVQKILKITLHILLYSIL